jgi:hypothetical protein
MNKINNIAVSQTGDHVHDAVLEVLAIMPIIGELTMAEAGIVSGIATT